jgi:hypothetical protein
MSGQAKSRRRSAPRGCFLGCLRQFLTPQLFKQAHQAAGEGRRCRWELQPLLFVLLAMTWCQGDSCPERFETARAFYVALHHKRRRPGKTAEGFDKALCRLPCRVLRLVAGAIRGCLLARLGPLLQTDGWKVFGCDGTALACPRTAELEQRLGTAGGKPGGLPPVPQVALSALVHLSSGLLWAWRLGKGGASERDHLRALLGTLPAGALLVADCGYQGYALACDLAGASLAFLIRVSSLTTFYSDEPAPGDWSDGEVWYWPLEAQRSGQKPLRVRLLRLRSPGRKHDVWLVTNVLQKERLTPQQASRFYRMRWENEGFFRSYKRTLNKVKLCSRSVALVHREAEGSLLAVQLLLAQGAAARLLYGKKQQGQSVRELLLEVRREIQEQLRGQRRGRGGYQRRLAEAQRRRRDRTSSKVKRVWPSRTDHTPPKPPKLRMLNDSQKALLRKRLHTP